MQKIYTKVLLVFMALSGVLQLNAQTYSDGPIQMQVRLRDVKVQYDNTNRRDAVSLSVGNFNLPGSLSGDEFTYNFTVGDNAVLAPPASTGCLQADLPIAGGTDYSTDHNLVIFNHTYPTPTVPQFFTLGIDAHEDDIPSDFAPISGLTPCGSSGSRCAYNGSMCCLNVITCLFSEEDDYHLVAPNYNTTLNYRLGPPCQWFDHGYVNGTAGSFDFYHPKLESYWRYTKGTSCADAIDLGTLNPGGSALSHYNSNECYSNNFATSGGNDVFYKFHVNSAIGATISLCGVNGAQFNSVLYLLNSSCTAIDNNDDGCGNQSVINKSICQPGDYYIVVDAATAGDMGTFTLSITENPNFTFSTTITPTHVSCFGQTDGSALAVVNGGTPNFTYSWSNSTTVNPATGLGGGPVSVTVSDANGCQASASATINVPAQIGLTTTTTPVSCGGSNNGTATANATGGTTPYSYLWNSAPPQTFQTATLLPTGTYGVTVTDDEGCTVSATANVQSATTIVITVDSVNDVQCQGLNNGSIYITTSGGQTPYVYNWSNGPTTEDNIGLAQGIYSVTISDAISCTLLGTYTIAEPPVLTTAVSNTFNPRCNAGTDGIVNITVNGGTQPYSYLWNTNNTTTQHLNNVGAGTHTVTVTDASNCTATATSTLTQPTPFSITLSTTNLLCYGGTDGAASVTVSGQTAPYTYFWSNFATTTNTTGLDAGPFSVVIEDVNGCDTIVTSTIGQPAEIDIQLTANEPLCADAGNGSITTVVTGGNPPFGYSWTGTGGFTSTSQNPQVGTGNYTVTVTDANNCTGTGSVAVTAPSPFTVTVVGIDPSCIGDSTGAAVVSTTGGNGPYSYSWNASSVDSAFLENLPAGTYSVTVTDANGCQSNGQATITEPLTDPESCKDDKFIVLVPTAFTPNSDGTNDNLTVIMRNVQKVEFSVYNRWGEQVYVNTNLLPGEKGWDGTFRGQPQPVGAYMWSMHVTYTNGVHAAERGAASLIR